MKTETAKNLCALWHGGQFSNLYQFASSGIFVPENSLLYIEEITQELLRPENSLRPFVRSKKDTTDLQKLRSFFLSLANTCGIEIRIEKDFYGNELPALWSANNNNVLGFKRIQ